MNITCHTYRIQMKKKSSKQELGRFWITGNLNQISHTKILKSKEKKK